MSSFRCVIGVLLSCAVYQQLTRCPLDLFRHAAKRILPLLCTCITLGLAVPVLEPQHLLNVSPRSATTPKLLLRYSLFLLPQVSHTPGDGGWENWSEWSRCSQACGSGVSCQERQCRYVSASSSKLRWISAPRSGTVAQSTVSINYVRSSDTCFGSRRRYRSCNVQVRWSWTRHHYSSLFKLSTSSTHCAIVSVFMISGGIVT